MLDVFFTQAIVIFVLVNMLFALALYKKDNSIIDIFFGPLIFITSLVSMLFINLSSVNIFLLSFLVLFLAWSLRISSRIYNKNKGKVEDFRYANFRKDWLTRSQSYFYIRSYLQIFILQGVIVLLMSITPSFIILNSVFVTSLSFVFLALAFVGLFIETISDMQLDLFIKNKKSLSIKNNEKIMKSGLWKYSRHPNYFGESIFWFGLGLSAFTLYIFSPLLLLTLSNGAVFLFLLFCFISPLLITALLLFVSGVPMLEKRWDDEGSAEWRDYKSKTCKFIIWLNK
jgi:steroid 5-alpha reductase family enzyme